MDINKMTIKEFKTLKFINTQFEKPKNIFFTGVVLLPMDGRRLHDSGYRNIDFIACQGNEPIGKLSGCSDVLHINGIGACIRYKKTVNGCAVDYNVSWSIDCLPTSGLFRLFGDHKLTCDYPLSSFSVYALKKETK